MLREVSWAQVDDAEGIAEVQNAVNADRAQREGRANTARIRTAGPIRDQIANWVEGTLDCPLVVRVDHRVVGCVYMSLQAPDFWPPTIWEDPSAPGMGVFGLDVHPEFQRQGNGSLLMSAVESIAIDHKIAYVRLDTYPHWQQAMSFYHHLRYTDRGQTDLNGTPLAFFEKRVF